MPQNCEIKISQHFNGLPHLLQFVGVVRGLSFGLYIVFLFYPVFTNNIYTKRSLKVNRAKEFKSVNINKYILLAGFDIKNITVHTYVFLKLKNVYFGARCILINTGYNLLLFVRTLLGSSPVLPTIIVSAVSNKKGGTDKIV